MVVWVAFGANSLDSWYPKACLNISLSKNLTFNVTEIYKKVKLVFLVCRKKQFLAVFEHSGLDTIEEMLFKSEID
jgi:hypothetical protein